MSGHRESQMSDDALNVNPIIGTEKRKNEIPTGYCQCGCGKETSLSKTTDVLRGYKKGKHVRFIVGHSSRIHQIKENNHRWKGGHSGTKIYYVWAHMIDRCYNQKSESYKYYGGRKIIVCKDWHDVKNFISWATKNLPKTAENLEIDRINNMGNYSPNNCRFTSRKVNARNTSASKKWHINGTKYPSLRAAAKNNGVSGCTIIRWCNDSRKENCWSEKLYK